MSPSHPTRSVDSAGPGVSPASSKAKSAFGLSWEHEKCCNSLRAIRGRMPKNVLHTGLLYAGAGEALIKNKNILDKSPLLAAGGEGGLGISKNIIDFLFASQNKNNPLPQCFHSYAEINIQIPRLFPVDFFGAQNKLFPELKHY